jgi:hypothetical protein
MLAGSRATRTWPRHSCSPRSWSRLKRTSSARRSWDWPASSVSEISDIAWPITTSGAGGLPPGSGAVARKLSCQPIDVSFTHSKHTMATEVGQHTPATATSNGTSRSPPGPAIRDCQYSWAPGRTVSSPFVTPQAFPRSMRSSADLWFSQDGLGPLLGQQAQHHECIRHRHQAQRVGEQRPVRRPQQGLGCQRPQTVVRVHRVIVHRKESMKVSRG